MPKGGRRGLASPQSGTCLSGARADRELLETTGRPAPPDPVDQEPEDPSTRPCRCEVCVQVGGRPGLRQAAWHGPSAAMARSDSPCRPGQLARRMDLLEAKVLRPGKS